MKAKTVSMRFAPLIAASLLTAACGGQMPFSGQLNVAGSLPPPPPPKIEKPKPPARVEVRDNKIEIHEKIHFESRKAVIQEDSFDLMNEIVQVIQDNPQILKISIEGHTDHIGTDEYNQDLSDKRAKAVVDYLVEHGVDAGRLTSKGFGEGSPIADNETDEGREKNRRVEFTIVEQKVTKTTVEIDESGKEKVVKKEEVPPKTSSLSKPKKSEEADSADAAKSEKN